MCSSGFKCYRHQNSFQVFFGLGHCNCSQRRGKFLESDNEKLTRLWTKAGSLAMLTMGKRGTWTLEGCLERCAQHSICSLKLVKDQHVVVFVCLVWHIWIYLSTFDLGIDSFECGRWYFHSCTLCSWSLQAWFGSTSIVTLVIGICVQIALWHVDSWSVTVIELVGCRASNLRKTQLPRLASVRNGCACGNRISGATTVEPLQRLSSGEL